MNLFAKPESSYGIVEILVKESYLDKSKAIEYQCLAKKKELDFLHFLVLNQIFSERELAIIIADHYGLIFKDLDEFCLNTIPSSEISEKLIREHRFLPLIIHNRSIQIAIDDPSNTQAFKEIEFHTGLQVSMVVVETLKLHKLREKVLSLHASTTIKNSENASKFDLETVLSLSNDETPIVKFINKILLQAVTKSVSDIHFEPYENVFRIRFRKDGLLSEVASLPLNLEKRFTSRIKIMANLDIAEKRLPQDGRFKIKLIETHNFRVSTCPTIAGEKVVLRLLDSSKSLSIEDLGLSEFQKQKFLQAIQKPQGLILVTGPTGSGKTITLYTALNILNSEQVNIYTAEDPVEIKIAGINQVNISYKTGLGFSESLRAFLRQDPDIIMVGEIRDLETAKITINAAQTGHLVLSTLHTNSAAETLVRLSNMGIPAYNVASALSLIISQRLVRRLCDACKKERNDLTRDELSLLGFSIAENPPIKIFQAKGCNLCLNGYHGRIAIFEILSVSKNLAKLIAANADSSSILKQAETEGMLTLHQSTLLKLSLGETTIEELRRVLR